MSLVKPILSFNSLFHVFFVFQGFTVVIALIAGRGQLPVRCYVQRVFVDWLAKLTLNILKFLDTVDKHSFLLAMA